MSVKFSIVMIVFLVAFVGCKESESLTAFENMQFSIEKDEVTCTEAWLRVKSNTDSKSLQMNLLQDGKQRRKFTMQSKDTVIYVDSLDAGKNYSFRFEMNGEKSLVVDIRTMDTTSHNIEWTTSEFGGVGGSSDMYDVSIVDENDIWAVGEFYPGHSGQPWAVAHWDGVSWKYSKAWYSDIPRLPKWNHALQTVWAFDKNNVYAACGSTLLKWNGDTTWNIVAFLWDFEATTDGASITKMWAGSENDIYIAAQKGYIYHYTGNGKFTKLKANTDMNFYDIYGNYDSGTGKQIIFAVNTDLNSFTTGKVYKLTENTVQEYSNNGLYSANSSIWFKNRNKLYRGGDGLYTQVFPNAEWKELKGVTRYYSYRVRGNDYNDVYVVGGCGETLHFNGKSWKSYKYLMPTGGNYFGLAVKGNTMVAVGYNDRKAVITIGKRK